MLPWLVPLACSLPPFEPHARGELRLARAAGKRGCLPVSSLEGGWCQAGRQAGSWSQVGAHCTLAGMGVFPVWGPRRLAPILGCPKDSARPQAVLGTQVPPSLPFTHSRALADVREVSEREAKQA